VHCKPPQPSEYARLRALAFWAREKEISGITDRLLSSTPDSIEAQIEEVRRLVSLIDN
jgi:hypothetical protein